MFHTPLNRFVAGWALVFAAILICGAWVGLSAAEERAIYSPIIHVNKEKGFIVVSGDSGVIGVEVGPAGRKHLGKLPPSGMIDIVVEMRKGKPPYLKSWKVVAGDSSCKHFDGKRCR